MKSHFIVWLVVGAAVLGSGAGAQGGERVHSRGWIGGEFEQAHPPRFFRQRDTVYAFPSGLNQKSGVLLVGLATNAPLYEAGLRAGDLMLAIDGAPIESVRELRRTIDQCAPGKTIEATFWREGEVLRLPVRVGRETYRKIRTIGFGIHLNSRLDLWPNPDFSLIAAGFDRREKRVELEGVRTRYVRSVAAAANEKETEAKPVSSGEGWNLWLVILHAGAHKHILKQETTTAAPMALGVGRNAVALRVETNVR